MRVDCHAKYNEYRDAISHDWLKLAGLYGWDIVLLPNCLPDVAEYLNSLQPSAVILTGGNDVSSFFAGDDYDGGFSSTERDETEKAVLKYSTNRKLPVLGVCRGMQMINLYFGGQIKRNIENIEDLKSHHAGTIHNLQLSAQFPASGIDRAVATNSFHQQGVTDDVLADQLEVVARCGRVIEAVLHRELPVMGVQWHPERPGNSNSLDVILLRSFMKGFQDLRNR